jgi:hypothetical protein
LSTFVLADADAASAFFNLGVTTEPTIAVETVTRPSRESVRKNIL